uniref:Uncharacterized protein n=1 Tax=Anguilla anguilla TaxID=7936 RepID=A0A0E9TEQ5_ANGAN
MQYLTLGGQGNDLIFSCLVDILLIPLCVVVILCLCSSAADSPRRLQPSGNLLWRT